MFKRVVYSIMAAGLAWACGAFTIDLIVPIKESRNWRAPSSALFRLEIDLIEIIREQGSLPEEATINEAITSVFNEDPHNRRPIQDDEMEAALSRFAAKIRDHPDLGWWNSPPVFVAKPDLPKGFGFYLKGADGVSNSEGMDPDDLNSWDSRDGQYYAHEEWVKQIVTVGTFAAIPALFAFPLAFRWLRIDDRVAMLSKWVRRGFLFVILPLGAILSLLLVSIFRLLGWPWESEPGYPSWKHDLPPTATEVHETASGETFIGEYNYYLRAKITEAEFMEFCHRLELTPGLAEEEEPRLAPSVSWNWRGYPKACGGWWTPSPSHETTFSWREGSTWSFAKHEDGILYFCSFSH